MSDLHTPEPERVYSPKEQRMMAKLEKRRVRIARELLALQEDYKATFGPLEAVEPNYDRRFDRYAWGIADIEAQPEEHEETPLSEVIASVQSMSAIGDPEPAAFPTIAPPPQTPVIPVAPISKAPAVPVAPIPEAQPIPVALVAEAAAKEAPVLITRPAVPVDEQPTQRMPRWNPAAFTAKIPDPVSDAPDHQAELPEIMNPKHPAPPATDITTSMAQHAAPAPALHPPIAEPARLEGFFTMAPRSNNTASRGPTVQRTVISQGDHHVAPSVPVTSTSKMPAAFEPITIERPADQPLIRRDEPYTQEPVSESPSEEWEETERRRKPRGVGVIVSILLVVLLAAGAFVGYEMYLANSKIYPNKVHFAPLPWDDTVVVTAGGLHHSEALVRLESQRDAFLKDTAIDVMIGNTAHTITPGDLGLYQETSALLDAIDAQIYNGSLIDHTITRIKLELDADQVIKLTWQCDINIINETAERLYNQLVQPGPGAALTGFDPQTQDFVVAQGSPVMSVDMHMIASALLQYVEAQAFGEPLVIAGIYSDPAQDAALLRSQIATLGEETLVLSGLSADAKANLAAIAAALDGTVISPNTSWSMKSMLQSLPEDAWAAPDGAETWLAAHPGADIAATSIFNAAVKAGLTAQRQNAAVPPDFIELGMDATLSETADLTILNPGEQAVILRLSASETGISASLMGISIVEAGVTLRLEAIVTETIPAPEGQDFQNDSNVYEGEEVVAHGPVDGQVVQVNLVTMRDGAQVDTTPLETLTYPPARELVLTGTKKKR